MLSTIDTDDFTLEVFELRLRDLKVRQRVVEAQLEDALKKAEEINASLNQERACLAYELDRLLTRAAQNLPDRHPAKDQSPTVT